jgi:NAD(P)-dependent dehydrogenase (short-subunit alcohol dehydrogenase family)
MTDIQEKLAFITGGASGIGLGLAHAVVKAGAKVVLAARNSERLGRALASFQGREHAVLPLVVDVTNRDSMVQAADCAERTFGPVQTLCNNAGVLVTARASDATYEDWDWAMSVNVGGVINCLQTFLPRMKDRGVGHLVTTASMSGLFASSPAGIYTTTKFALVGMMEALQGELAQYRIGVSIACSGLVNTDLHLAEEGRPQRYRSGERGGPVLDAHRLKQDFPKKGWPCWKWDAGSLPASGAITSTSSRIRSTGAASGSAAKRCSHRSRRNRNRCPTPGCALRL